MRPREESINEAQPLVPAFAMAALLASLAGGLNLLANLLGVAQSVPLPYVWRDVALVHFVAALPLAAVLACCCLGRVPGLLLVVATLLSLACTIAVLLGVAPAGAAQNSTTWLRLVPALSGALAVCLGLASIALYFGGSRSPCAIPWAEVIVGVLVLIVVPAAYVDARCRNDADRLSGLLEQSRLGEALELARGLAALDAAQTVRGQSPGTVRSDLEIVVGNVEKRLARSLQGNATATQRLERARDLAMLGRTTESLRILDEPSNVAYSSDAHLLRATIYETREEWVRGGQEYRTARERLNPFSVSQSRTRNLLRAMLGEAHCERKLGNLSTAEAIYLNALSLEPTADMYFILAQFYEDTQQVGKSQAHARKAMELDRANYERKGKMLLDKLATHHFGCLSIRLRR